MKKLSVIGLMMLYIIYIYTIATKNDMIGNLISPIITLILAGIIYYGFLWKTKINPMIWSGRVLFLAVFTWAICDIWWAIEYDLLHVNPDTGLVSLYGYFLTNVFLFIAVLIKARQDVKVMNRIQAMLDTIIVFICMAVLLWLFVFEQNHNKVAVIYSDGIAFASLFIDIAIYVWINVWSFATRLLQPPLYQRIMMTGCLVYVVTDAIYYYMYFYTSYTSNSWVDGAYVLSFSFLALGAYMKKKTNKGYHISTIEGSITGRIRMELLVLVVPFMVFIWKRSEVEYLLLLVASLMVYFILINYTQKSIFQKTLLDLEKKNVAELELKIQERTEEIIRTQNTDYLSGLYSRRYFDEKLLQVRNDLENDEQLALLYIDQSRSRTIRYLFGKDVTERLLKMVAEAIRQIAVGENVTLAAYGDDVFVVLIQGKEVEEDAKKMAEQIINRCDKLFYVNNHAILITLNIGISFYPLDTLNVNNLTRNADVAMLQARANGLNRIQIYDKKIGDLTYSRHQVEMKLKKVVYDKEFLLYYQPQVFSNSGELCGFEALIRWKDDNGKLIPPMDFIPVTEEIGMIVPLGYWIIEQAAKQHTLWRERTGKDYRISVNVSTRQLVEADFLQRLQEILRKYDVPTASFEIEITESHQIENSVNIAAILNGIRGLGVSLAMDDFGTGYSSLYYIKNMPTDRIKIAKELIDNIENDIYSYYIIQMVISIAREKRIAVIAEGVETKEQWECLKELGCDEIQGYYFAKPMPVTEIEEKWL